MVKTHCNLGGLLPIHIVQIINGEIIICANLCLSAQQKQTHNVLVGFLHKYCLPEGQIHHYEKPTRDESQTDNPKRNRINRSEVTILLFYLAINRNDKRCFLLDDFATTFPNDSA